MIRSLSWLRTLFVSWLLIPGIASADPIFDVHTHFKWNQEEIISAEEVILRLKQQNIDRVVVIGTPPELALKLYRLDPERIIPFYGPYKSGGEKLAWQFRRSLVDEVRTALESGQYKGIGELHLIGGMAVNWRKGPVFSKLMLLAEKYGAPVMLHTEYISPKPTLDICGSHPNVRILLAHSGAVLQPVDVDRILDRCPNVWMDLAARDPWRYVRNPITDKQGRLLPEWEKLIISYPERFMIGSDTVWPVDKPSGWDEADTGWDELGRFIGFHRTWASYFPDSLRRAVLWQNAHRFFRLGIKQ